MNLKLVLLIRVTLMRLLCRLGVSIYWSVNPAGERLMTSLAWADQLQPMVSADVMRR